ncbi:MAG: proline racemase family protein, partial [Desulfobacterales bacterium]|nr:proline racemase family protein [Desulfobacterales bacterium]
KETAMQSYINRITTTDAHVSGEPIRVIPPDALDLEGNSIIEKRDYFSSHLDYLRQALILEPRGHENMFGAVACRARAKEADLGLFFMDTKGYLNMCGHGTIGTVTILLEKGFLSPDKECLVIETPSGLIRAEFEMEGDKVSRVSFRSVPAFVYDTGIEVHTPGFGDLRADIVFSGNFFIMIDSTRLPCELAGENLGTLIPEAMAIKEQLNAKLSVSHPLEPHISGMDLVQFYNSQETGSYNNCVIFGQGQVDRSPCGTGLSGLLALMAHYGTAGPGQEVICQSILGTSLTGKIAARTRVDRYDAIIPEITGTGFITGTHEFILDREDPFRQGFLMQV